MPGEVVEEMLEGLEGLLNGVVESVVQKYKCRRRGSVEKEWRLIRPFLVVTGPTVVRLLEAPDKFKLSKFIIGKLLYMDMKAEVLSKGPTWG